MTGGTAATNISVGIRLIMLNMITDIVGTFAAVGIMMVVLFFLFFSICRRSFPNQNAEEFRPLVVDLAETFAAHRVDIAIGALAAGSAGRHFRSGQDAAD